MTTPDPTPDIAELIERAWRALKRRPVNVADDDCAWFVSRTTRDALQAHRYEGPGSNPVAVRQPCACQHHQTGHQVWLFNVRVISGENLGNHVLLLAMEA